MLKYDAHHYDDQLRLKISVLLWLVLIYGVRHFFFVAAAKLMPLEVGVIAWLHMQAHPTLILGDLPALFILIATGHRIPGALRAMRWAWLHGRWILASSYLLGIALFLYSNQGRIGNFDNPYWAICVVLTDIAVIGYLLRSELIRDIFNEFPETPEEAKSPVKPVSTIRQLKQELNDTKRKELLQELIYASGTPADLQTGMEVQEWMQAAAKLESGGRLAEAETLYRELLKTFPDFAPAWHALGLLAYHAGKHEQGVALVEQAVASDGNAGLYPRNLGEMYRRMGRLQEAVSQGRAACRLLPEDAEACHNLGLALAGTGLLNEAVESYRAALKLNPQHGICWNNLGVVLQAMGDAAGAKQAYGEALKFNPANTEARNNLQAIISIKS